jgi:hypothetical protein
MLLKINSTLTDIAGSHYLYDNDKFTLFFEVFTMIVGINDAFLAPG